MEIGKSNIKENKEEPISDFKKFMRSHTARIIIVGIITLVLLIPLSQIGWLIKERKVRQDEVKEELKTEWGDELEYYGVVLEVPMLADEATRKKTGRSTTGMLYIYPESTKDNIDTKVNERYRGIFKSNLYTAVVNSSSVFDLASIVKQQKYSCADWSKVSVIMVTSEGARFKQLSEFKINDTAVQLGRQSEMGNVMYSCSETFALNPLSKNSIEVKASAKINGCSAMKYRPFAAKSNMELISNWIDPSFAGTSLPDNDSFKLTEHGFSASWNNMVSLGRGSSYSLNYINTGNRPSSEIKFMTMVDQYQLNDRTIKYGLLVLTLTFAVFFLIQIMGKMNIHPLHYLMIGLALLLFYSLLLAFSEHIGFNRAYMLAAGAIILLVGWYAKAVLSSLKFAIVSASSLTLLYAFLLVIVNLEIYAMLVGSIGLFVVLAAIMSITRKMNFNNM